METTKLGHGLLAIVLVTGLLNAMACRDAKATTEATASKVIPAPGPNAATGSSPSETPADPPAPPVAARVSERAANSDGKIFVAEYHHVAVGKGDMFRTPKEFRADLERLHRLGFRPCTVSDYLEGKFPMGAGASPVVFTFDDSNPSQLQLRDDGSVDPNCAVGIWQKFAEEHPDFPVRATFFVLPDVMFGQPKLRAKKVELLRSLGCELASHTVTHPILKRLDDESVKREFAGAIDALENLGVEGPVSLALPFGVSPRNPDLLREFKYKGKAYAMKAAFLVGANPAPAPDSKDLDRYRIPRIQAYGGPYGLDYWLDLVERDKVTLYVTGEPD
jgi:peptidoglycan/xylan/chitin deacetylase (PgdA/CDA1 family)